VKAAAAEAASERQKIKKSASHLKFDMLINDDGEVDSNNLDAMFEEQTQQLSQSAAISPAEGISMTEIPDR
jgi:hypothetical protein